MWAGVSSPSLLPSEQSACLIDICSYALSPFPSPCPFLFSWKLVKYTQKCALDWLDFKNWKAPLALPISLALSPPAPAIPTMVGTCWTGLPLRVLVCDSGSASWDKKPLSWTYQSSALGFDTKHTVPIQHYSLLTLLHLNLKFASHKNPLGLSRDGKLGLSQGPSGCAIRDDIVWRSATRHLNSKSRISHLLADWQVTQTLCLCFLVYKMGTSVPSS